MHRQKCKIIRLPDFVVLSVVFSLLSVLLIVSCKGKAGAGSPGGAPGVEKAQELPAIRRGGEGLLVAYRHTGFGYADANGFDTLVYRFQELPGGWLDGAIVYERRLEGEKEIRRYSFSYAGDQVVVAESSEGAAKEIAWVKISKDALEIRGTAERIVSRGPGGSLVVGSFPGDYSEEYMIPAGGNGKKSLISRSGIVEAEGSYTFPSRGRVVYRERRAGDSTGAEELQLSLWIDDRGDFRFRTEGVVPINEVYASGFKDSFGGDRGLLNIALVDLVLGKTKNIRPVLAYALSRP